MHRRIWINNMSKTHVGTHEDRWQNVFKLAKFRLIFIRKFGWFLIEKTIDFGHERQDVEKNILKKKSIEIDWNFKHFQSRLKKSISVDFFQSWSLWEHGKLPRKLAYSILHWFSAAKQRQQLAKKQFNYHLARLKIHPLIEQLNC